MVEERSKVRNEKSAYIVGQLDYKKKVRDFPVLSRRTKEKEGCIGKSMYFCGRKTRKTFPTRNPILKSEI